MRPPKPGSSVPPLDPSGRHYRTVDGTTPPNVLLSKTRSLVPSEATNGGRYALLGSGILHYRYRRRRLWIWRHRSHGFKYRADPIFCIFSDLPDYSGHGDGGSAATANLNTSRLVEVRAGPHQQRVFNRRRQAREQADLTLPDGVRSGFGRNCGQAQGTFAHAG